MDAKEKFKEGRKGKGYYGYLHDTFAEMVKKGELEDYSPGLKGIPGIPENEFADKKILPGKLSSKLKRYELDMSKLKILDRGKLERALRKLSTED